MNSYRKIQGLRRITFAAVVPLFFGVCHKPITKNYSGEVSIRYEDTICTLEFTGSVTENTFGRKDYRVSFNDNSHIAFSGYDKGCDGWDSLRIVYNNSEYTGIEDAIIRGEVLADLSLNAIRAAAEFMKTECPNENLDSGKINSRNPAIRVLINSELPSQESEYQEKPSNNSSL